MSGFEFESIDDVRRQLLPTDDEIHGRLGNGTSVAIAAPAASSKGFERVADVPIHFADPLVRRAPSLQQTADAKPPRARLNAITLQQIGVAEGPRSACGRGAARRCSTATVDAAVPAGVVRIAAAHPSTCGLDGLSGPITVERA